MAVHTGPQRAFIVRKLAAFYPVKDICAAFVVQFSDTACSDADVLVNDPGVTLLPPELDALFREERARVMTDPSLAPFAEQHARLIVLSRLVEHYLRNNQPAEARSVMRQIAEETGDVAKGSGKAAGNSISEPVIAIVRKIIDPVAAVST